jgi:asparagine synthase (glutamine-hydrolysing)
MVVREDGVLTERWWSLPFYPPEQRFPGSQEEARAVLEALLKDAVRLRLRADVPVGAYLSGGLDSSMTSALIARFFNNRVKTFSIGFQEPDFDESGYQQEMAAWLGTDHHRALVNNSNIREHFADLVWHCEKPILRTAPVPLYLLSRLVRENDFKVVLTGEGADEVFGGYNIFKEAKVRAFWGRRPESRLRPMLLERLYPYVFKNPARGRAFLYGFYAINPGELEDPLLSHRIRWKNTGKNQLFFSDDLRELFSKTDLEKLVSERLPSEFEKRDLLSRAQYLEMDLFLSNYLLSAQGDRPAMAHSLEIRLPFLDHRVIDFAMRLPPQWKIRGLNEKYILKQAFNGLLPDRIKNRSKQPYRAPIREVFFSGPGGDYVDEMLSVTALKKAGLFHPKKVERLLSKYRNGGHGSEVQNMAVVGILSTQLLHHQYIENDAGSGVEPLQPDKVIRKTVD